jgi:hypothetical protein
MPLDYQVLENYHDANERVLLEANLHEATARIKQRPKRSLDQLVEMSKKMWPTLESALTYLTSTIKDFQENDDPHFELAEELTDANDATSRIKEDKKSSLFKESFPDQSLAFTYARKNIADFQEENDPHFEVANEVDAEVESQIVDALSWIVNRAIQDDAAIVIPDYTTSTPSSKLIEQVLNDTDFQGPVINVGNNKWIACDRASSNSRICMAGDKVPKEKGFVLSKTTHSFQIIGDAMSYSQLAARIATVLANGSGDRPQAKSDLLQLALEGEYFKSNDGEIISKEENILAVVAGGGASVLNHMAELALEGIPIILLQGSGGICNTLPNLYIKRFSTEFDVIKASKNFCSKSGFPCDDEADQNTNLLTQVLQVVQGQSGQGKSCTKSVQVILENSNLNIHQLSKGLFALKRVFRIAKHDDNALILAQTRCAEYYAAASVIEKPSRNMLLLKVSVGFVVTLLATMQGQAGTIQEAETAELKQVQGSFNQTFTKIEGRGPVMHYFVVALPIIFTLLSSLQQTFNYGPKYLSLNYGAAQVESEMYRYRTRTGVYGEGQLIKLGDKAATDQDTPGLCGSVFEVNAATYDTLSVRTYVLSKKLIEIGASMELFDKADDVNAEGKGMVADKNAIEWGQSEYRLGLLHGDEYIKIRIGKKIMDFNRQSRKLNALYWIYRIITWLVGALGTLFALVHLEVASTASPHHTLSIDKNFGSHPVDFCQAAHRLLRAPDRDGLQSPRHSCRL